MFRLIALCLLVQAVPAEMKKHLTDPVLNVGDTEFSISAEESKEAGAEETAAAAEEDAAEKHHEEAEQNLEEARDALREVTERENVAKSKAEVASRQADTAASDYAHEKEQYETLKCKHDSAVAEVSAAKEAADKAADAALAAKGKVDALAPLARAALAAADAAKKKLAAATAKAKSLAAASDAACARANEFTADQVVGKHKALWEKSKARAAKVSLDAKEAAVNAAKAQEAARATQEVATKAKILVDKALKEKHAKDFAFAKALLAKKNAQAKADTLKAAKIRAEDLAADTPNGYSKPLIRKVMTPTKGNVPLPTPGVKRAIDDSAKTLGKKFDTDEVAKMSQKLEVAAKNVQKTVVASTPDAAVAAISATKKAALMSQKL